MSDERRQDREPSADKGARLARTIAGQEVRRERALREPRSSLWRHVARVGTLGWMIVLPIVGGAGLGRLLDRRLGSGVTWTLAGIVLGVAVGGYSLWKTLDEEGAGP
ncbi:MAG: AtpZ/AtpI family protein [Nannocystaceae bacterium]